MTSSRQSSGTCQQHRAPRVRFHATCECSTPEAIRHSACIYHLATKIDQITPEWHSTIIPSPLQVAHHGLIYCRQPKGLHMRYLGLVDFGYSRHAAGSVFCARCFCTPATPAAVASSAAAPTVTVPIVAPIATPLYRAKLGTVERDITYCTNDGVALKMDVHYPHAMSKPAPVAVYVHGGSWSSGSKSDSIGMTDVPELLARGYLVASVDYRYAPQWKFPAQIHDVKCAIRFLRANATRFNLDPNRIGAWGHSAGGHLVTLLGTTDTRDGFEGSREYADQSSRVQAVVDMCGRADLRGNASGQGQVGVWRSKRHFRHSRHTPARSRSSQKTIRLS